MRLAASSILLLFTALGSIAHAQDKKEFLPPEIKKISVGFQTHQDQEQERSTFKVGLWTPVYVQVFGGTTGTEPKPNQAPPYLEFEVVDSEDVATQIQVPVAVEPLGTRTFIGYVKTGQMSLNRDGVKVTLRAANAAQTNPKVAEMYGSLPVNAHLYLVLGKRMPQLQSAVRKIGMGEIKDKEDFRFRGDTNGRAVVFEDDPDLLPEYWFGYNGVDLLVLSTENRPFLTKLANKDNRERLKAIAQWVRRGGRLVVPIAHQNQDAVAAVLKSEYAWQPAIPVIPPAAADAAFTNSLTRLSQMEDFGRVQGEPYERKDPTTQRFLPIPVATLDDGKVLPGDWEVFADSGDKSGNRALVARVRYGLGQITYMAVSLEDSAFLGWPGKDSFLQTTVLKLSTKAPHLIDPDGGFRKHDSPNDLSTELLGRLDKFDVTVIEFGYVALFIILYILVVGPLDFLLLKYVFKRLEWTWITFPSVVLAVSVIAYFAAYALKGRDLKINKIDIVDFDLRTSLDGKRRPQNVHAYGHSFFTILSPRIQNYSIGLEPNPLFWGDAVKRVKDASGMEADEVLSVDLLAWMGRPSDGPHNMGRSSSSGFFRKPYTFRSDASALEGVPIPVWTTKAFSASWEQALDKPPFAVDLVYHQKGDVRISGQLDNLLAVDLVDVWVIYDKKCFAIRNGLKAGKANGALQIQARPTEDIRAWSNLSAAREANEQPRMWTMDPTNLIKQMMFHERFDTQNVGRNHLLRPLDLGWRVDEEPTGRHDTRTREAILFGRVTYVHGQAEDVVKSGTNPPATKLWLGDTPGRGRPRPSLSGQMNQDTYVRVILPVRPADE